jgi:hypothetical protein
MTPPFFLVVAGKNLLALFLFERNRSSDPNAKIEGAPGKRQATGLARRMEARSLLYAPSG